MATLPSTYKGNIFTDARDSDVDILGGGVIIHPVPLDLCIPLH